MFKPRIGITTDADVHTAPAMPNAYPQYVPHDIIAAVTEAGGIPVILPFPDDTTKEAEYVHDYADLYDALLLPGGLDVDPTFYNVEPIRAIGGTFHAEDAFEIALIQAAVAAGKPILGICRGMQVINVALGGTLYQDLLTENPASYIQHAQAAPGHFPTHHAEVDPQSRLFSIIGASTIINSRHHQAVRATGAGLDVAALAPDGVVEAIESSTGNQIMAVQWHPENLWQANTQHLAVFSDLIARATNYRARSAQ